MPVVRISRQPTPVPPPPCYLFKFPNELLAETISWLQHPDDILSFSHTCKKLYEYLRDPTTSYVWRHVRENFVAIKSHTINDRRRVDELDELDTLDELDESDELEPYNFFERIVHIPGDLGLLDIKMVDSPIPAPFDGMTEYAYARMLFGLKLCDICGSGYSGKPWSFSIRLSMCQVCRVKRKSLHVIEENNAKAKLHRQIRVRSELFENLWTMLWNSVPLQSEEDWEDWPVPINPCTSSELWKSRIEELKQKRSQKDAKTFEVTLKKRIERVFVNKQHIDHIQLWYQTYRHHIKETKACIEDSARVFGLSQGLPLEDMKKSKIYKHTLAEAEKLQMVEMVSLLRPNLSELRLQTLKNQADRVSEWKKRAQKKRKKEIEGFYKDFPFEGGIKPCLDTFRNFPILQTLQSGIAATGTKSSAHEFSIEMVEGGGRRPIALSRGISTYLGHEMIQELVKTSLGQWQMEAVTGARKLLGFETVAAKSGKKRNKKKKGTVDGKIGAPVEETSQLVFPVPSTSTTTNGVSDSAMDGTSRIWNPIPGKLDPELRVTSWFICTRCTNLDAPYNRMRVLDFRGICSHVCWEKDRSRSQQRSWNIGIFAPAPRTMNTARKMLETLQLDPEDPGTNQNCFEGWWTCNHCPKWMNAMVWQDLLRHCQRHASQNIARVSDQEASKRREALRICEKQLSFADLLSGNYEFHALTKQFACIHCRPSPTTHDAPPKATEKVMDIYGIRQHMKSKHHVEDCRNEDFYYVESALTQLPSKEIKPARPPNKKKDKSKPSGLGEIIDMRY
ncbi:hypothetical protein M408DRAFT_333054 [Serendipita vermifera MAFF 305830]|uniref:F-box domain-containing protein n=1 Tax=Serendipita vermifera MAFF 305830 TaxID=933852 RepID=A0A0C2W6V4_SERVB|nr:hypothetical protein M408DRAFT_333054 [Serendipita vermifera MAFF 305830]